MYSVFRVSKIHLSLGCIQRFSQKKATKVLHFVTELRNNIFQHWPGKIFISLFQILFDWRDSSEIWNSVFVDNRSKSRIFSKQIAGYWRVLVIHISSICNYVDKTLCFRNTVSVHNIGFEANYFAKTLSQRMCGEHNDSRSEKGNWFSYIFCAVAFSIWKKITIVIRKGSALNATKKPIILSWHKKSF